METLPLYVTMALATVIGMTILALIALRAFRAWIELKTLELGAAGNAASPSAAQRIDVADLKERIRKLEAIASGVDI